MKVAKITLNGISYIDTLDGAAVCIENELNEAEPGTVYTVEVLEMSEQEFKNLPEFDGF